MKRQINQFDNGRTHATVATPTCSSCCCCCCCLTTTLASSTLLARRVNKEARAKKVKDPIGLTFLAALYLPVIAGITYLMTFAINHHFGGCIQDSYDNGYGNMVPYTSCSTPAYEWYVLVPVIILAAIIVLGYLYTRIKMPTPMLRAVIVTAVVAGAFIAEAFVGGWLILTGVGAIGYLVLVPILYSATQRFYSKYVMHETILGNKA